MNEDNVFELIFVSDTETNEARRSTQIFEEIIIDEKWRRERKETLAIFCLHFFAIGMDYTIIQSTLWTYIKQGMHTSQPKLIYGVISSVVFIFPLFLNLFISRWFDEHRRLKLVAIVMNALATVGYVLYIIPSSPWFPIFGMTLFGVVLVFNVIVYSEILRVYKNDEIPGKLSLIMIAYSLGEITGPIIVKLLDKVDFWVGSLHIMFFTMPSVIVVIFSIIKLILMFFFLHDISRKHKLNVNEPQAEETGTSEITIPMSWFHKLISTFGVDAILLLFQQFYSSYFTTLYPRLIPLIMDTLGYNNLDVDLCFIAVSVFITIFSFIVIKTRPSSLGIFNFGILSLLFLMLGNIIIIIIRKDLNDVVTWILLIAFLACYSFCWISVNTFINFTFGRLFDSSNQSFAEGIRLVVQLTGSIIASFASAYVYEYFMYSFPVYAVANVLLLIGMIIRRKTLCNPQVKMG